MIKSLRKRHFQVWSLIAIILPAGLVASLLLRPGPVTGKLLQPVAVNALPVIIQEKKKEGFTVRLRGSFSGQSLQLEWMNTSVLPYPTAVIYKIPPGRFNIQGSTLIGRVEARGTYRFELPAGSPGNDHFVVYDFIKERLVDSFRFSYSHPLQQPRP